MRLLSVRLIIALVVGIALVSLASSYHEVRAEKISLRRDLEHRAEVLAESLAGNVETRLDRGSTHELQRIVERFSNREHLDGVAIYDKAGSAVAVTPGLTPALGNLGAIAEQAVASNAASSQFTRLGAMRMHIYALPLHQHDEVVGALAIVHDSSYIDKEGNRIWRETFLRDLIQVFLISMLTIVIVRWSIAGPIAKAAQWMRALRTGKPAPPSSRPSLDVLSPLTREVETLARSLTDARDAAEKEAQLRDAAESLWTAERLSVHLRTKLHGSRLFVVSNREPYSHVHKGKSIEVVVPPSGLVTALEPVLRACDGTWIAQGSGDADLETVDAHDRLRVPPDEPRYTLRRVWLTKEEEEGYYFGFANEGLWPLCHIAHTRPIFRASDWSYYQAVNRKFANALLEEISEFEQPIVLIQDYHFALLPRLIKQGRPDARVAIFWHIPWPNPEEFAICPWQRELIDGLLGADLAGFHTQTHCNNFMQTVDRTLESRIDWDHSTVVRDGHRTVVKPFPISVEFSDAPPPDSPNDSHYADRAGLLHELGVTAEFIGVGVDRIDYTKGILERFAAVERLLEVHPEYRSKFTLLQIGAPSRTHIKRYHDLISEVEAEAERINWRFQTSSWRPILYLQRHHSHQEITRFYRAADLCLVTSLHDGMNLVAKEFVSARSDDQGVLILSRFTGAVRELRDALIINPYDTEQTAEAIHRALEMPMEERRARMQRMRRVVKENNVYRWAANLIGEIGELRISHDYPSPEWKPPIETHLRIPERVQ
ncbi:MAG TPA: trehalose-6-phosphate synthase [Terriglobales bacterium]